MIFIDTNYFLRLLLKDVKEQHQQAKALFLRGAEGRAKLLTSTIVVFEIYWVLQSSYQKRREKIIEILEKILQLEFVEIDNKEVLQEALGIYKTTNLDLEDGYNLSLAKKRGIKEFKTFDKKLGRYFLKK